MSSLLLTSITIVVIKEAKIELWINIAFVREISPK